MSTESTYQIAVLAGDGIGPEVMQVTLGLLNTIADKHEFSLSYNEQPVGGAAIDATGGALPQATLEACEASDAILFGSGGSPEPTCRTLAFETPGSRSSAKSALTFKWARQQDSTTGQAQRARARFSLPAAR